jgi:hypothetical protein
MKFTPVALALSAVIAVAQVAALPVTPFLQEPGLIPVNPSSNTEHAVEAAYHILPEPANAYKDASESLPVHIPLPKKRLLSLVTGLLGGGKKD